MRGDPYGAQIADGLVESMMWTVTMKTPRWQLSFAVGHSRQLLEDLRRRYLKNDWRYHHEQEN